MTRTNKPFALGVVIVCVCVCTSKSASAQNKADEAKCTPTTMATAASAETKILVGAFGSIDTNRNNCVDQFELAAAMKRPFIERLEKEHLQVAGMGEVTVDSYLIQLAEEVVKDSSVVVGDGLNFAEFKAALGKPVGTTWAFSLASLLALQTSTPVTTTEELSPWQWLQEHFDVRKSFIDEQGIAEPAVISFSSYGKEDGTIEEGNERTQFLLQAAVSFLPDWEIRAGSLRLQTVLVLEVDMSQGRKEDTNKIVHRIGFTTFGPQGRHRARGLRPGLEHQVQATVDFTTDTGYRSELLGGTFEWFPNWVDIGIGQYVSYKPSRPVQFRWRPYAGLSYVHVLEAAGREDLIGLKNFTDVYARVAGELSLWKRLLFTPTVSVYGELQNGRQGHTLWQLPLQLVLARDANDEDAISLSGTYTHGEKSPLYKKERLGVVSLGIKF